MIGVSSISLAHVHEPTHADATVITALRIDFCQADMCDQTKSSKVVSLPKGVKCTPLNAIVLSMLWIDANIEDGKLDNASCIELGRDDA